MIYYQLGVAAHLELVNFHGMGEVESCYDRLILSFVVRGLEPKSECIFDIYSFWGGKD